MITDSKGDGPYTHGNSFANGPFVPGWVHCNQEYVLLCEMQAHVRP